MSRNPGLPLPLDRVISKAVLVLERIDAKYATTE
jgi:hypothetical protein